MNTTETAKPLGLGSTEGLGPLLEELAETAAYAHPKSGCVSVHASLLTQTRRELESRALVAPLLFPNGLSDEQIKEIADGMPGGLDGFLKGWGWQQFARAIESAHGIPMDERA